MPDTDLRTEDLVAKAAQAWERKQREQPPRMSDKTEAMLHAALQEALLVHPPMRDPLLIASLAEAICKAQSF